MIQPLTSHDLNLEPVSIDSAYTNPPPCTGSSFFVLLVPLPVMVLRSRRDNHHDLLTMHRLYGYMKKNDPISGRPTLGSSSLKMNLGGGEGPRVEGTIAHSPTRLSDGGRSATERIVWNEPPETDPPTILKNEVDLVILASGWDDWRVRRPWYSVRSLKGGQLWALDIARRHQAL